MPFLKTSLKKRGQERVSRNKMLRKTLCSFVFNIQLFPTRIDVPWVFWLSAVLVGRCTWWRFCGKLAHRKISMLLNIQCSGEAATWKIVSTLWGREKVCWGKQLSSLDSSTDLEGLGSVFALSQLFTKVVSNSDLPSSSPSRLPLTLSDLSRTKKIFICL